MANFTSSCKINVNKNANELQIRKYSRTKRMSMFIYSLFNDALIFIDYVASNNNVRLSTELEKTWKRIVVAKFGVLSRQ